MKKIQKVLDTCTEAKKMLRKHPLSQELIVLNNHEHLQSQIYDETHQHVITWTYSFSSETKIGNSLFPAIQNFYFTTQLISFTS